MNSDFQGPKTAKTYLGLCQTSVMKFFCENSLLVIEQHFKLQHSEAATVGVL